MGNSPSSSRSPSPSRPKFRFDPSLDRMEDSTHNTQSEMDVKQVNSDSKSHDPPPPYTLEAAASSSSSNHRSNDYLRAPMRSETAENALQTLRRYDTVLIVDDSGSMMGSKWKQAQKALASLADMAGKYDADGIDIAFLNNTKIGEGVRSGKEIDNLFEGVRPSGYTPIGERLEALILPYLARIEEAQREGVLNTIKPINFVVITDGEPTDDPESVIVATAQRLDRGNFPLTQLGIQLLQIGKDVSAATFLKTLDDELTNIHRIRDIVDTTPFEVTGGNLTSDLITKVLIGGINRRVDRKGASSIL